MSKHRNKQAGGTLLGLILGLIIGLSVAVVVAIMVKNVPLPFSSVGKAVKPEARAGKVPDASTPQNVDPNKALYGNKEAAKPVAEADKPAAVEPAKDVAKDAVKEAPKDVAREASKDPVATARADARAPVQDKSAALDPKAAKLDPAAGADEKFTYYLQAGAFLQQADAENAKAKLALMGMAASIAERKTENGTLYRVRIGPFAQLEAMNRVRSKLTDNGVDVAVVRVPK